MKRRIIFSILALVGIFVGNTQAYYIYYGQGWTWGINGIYSSPYDGTSLTGGALWKGYEPSDPSFVGIATTGDGDGAVYRGLWGDLDVELTITNNIVGRIHTPLGGDFYSSRYETTVIGGPDSSILGTTLGEHNKSQTLPDNAVTVFTKITKTGGEHFGRWNFYGGKYIGGNGFSGGLFFGGSVLDIKNASFLAGEIDYGNRGQKFAEAPSGLVVKWGTKYIKDGGVLTLFWDVMDYLAISNRPGDVIAGAPYGELAMSAEDLLDAKDSSDKLGIPVPHIGIGGHGLDAEVDVDVEINGGTFMGSQQNAGTSRTYDFRVPYARKGRPDITSDVVFYANGGAGALLTGEAEVEINGGHFIGGDAGKIIASGPRAELDAVGGSGLILFYPGGDITLNGGLYEGGESGQADVMPGVLPDGRTRYTNGIANASGGDGILMLAYSGSESVVMSGVEARGSDGGYARAGTALANGESGLEMENRGSGLRALEINGGIFVGGDGGTAEYFGSSGSARGGAGLDIVGIEATIHGGVFAGGEGGTINGQHDDRRDNIAILATDSDLEIDQSYTNTHIKGSIVFNDDTDTERTLSLTTANTPYDLIVGGDIILLGGEDSSTKITIGSGVSFNGAYYQSGGYNTVDLALSDGEKFSNVQLSKTATLEFLNAEMATATNAFFRASDNSYLSFSEGLGLTRGSSIHLDSAELFSGADLVMGDNTTLSFDSNLLSIDDATSVFVAFALVATNQNVKIKALKTIAETPTGTALLVGSSELADLGGKALEDIVEIDTGWLTEIDWASSAANNGIAIDYSYNSLTNSPLKDLDPGLLAYLDSRITNTVIISREEFLALNSLGAKDGAGSLRYGISQIPDMADASFQVQRQVAGQFAMRGTEFRSMNDLASTKPSIGRKASPSGAAGPQALGTESTMQGWIRVYGALASRDQQGNFESYDSMSYGTVVGVDKSFGNVLIGLAGGYGVGDIEGNTDYKADIRNYHGSIYSTIGGESTFVDLALTYGFSETEDSFGPTEEEFDSDIFSGYIGAGKTFGDKEKVAVTPEVSLLTSYYSQDAYNRTGATIGEGSIADYDTWSCLGSLGVNLATIHQIDWMQFGLAFIPEARAHWLHEFNADLDNFSYTIDGSTDSFGVRPREENLFRMGLGLDIWSWKHQAAKLEVDYDVLFSGDYSEHVFSGKVSTQF